MSWGSEGQWYEDKMLRVGEFSLISMRGYANSLQEVLKQTMIGQEALFRKQVQKTLMGESGCIELDACHFWKASFQCGLYTNPMRYASITEGKAFRNPVVGSTKSLPEDIVEVGHANYCKIQHTPISFHVSHHQHINYVGKDPLHKGNDQGLRGSLEPKGWFFGCNVSPPEEVDLTLKIGECTRRKDSDKAACHEKNAHLFSQHVINLEASTDMLPHDNTKLASALCDATRVTMDKQETQFHLNSNQSAFSVKKDLSHEATVSNSSIYGGISYEHDNSFNRGCKGSNRDITSDDNSLKGKSLSSHEATELDLNKVHFNDSFILNDSVVSLLPNPGSSRALDKLKGIHFEGACSTTADCCGTPTVNCTNEPSILQKDDDLSENLAETCHADITEALEEDATILHPSQDGIRLEDSNSNIICIHNDCSSGAKTSQSVEETQFTEPMNDESVEGDALILNAAKALVHFSLGSSTGTQDSREGLNQIENKVKDRPQRSFDSYESLVLKLEETSVDEYCVLSKAFEVDDLGKKDCGVKLRRGRRVKDFQKDILPNLVSLAKHEILEDVGIMEAVIRSREYKRMRSKICHGEDLIITTKNKRSKPRRRRP